MDRQETYNRKTTTDESRPTQNNKKAKKIPLKNNIKWKQNNTKEQKGKRNRTGKQHQMKEEQHKRTERREIYNWRTTSEVSRTTERQEKYDRKTTSDESTTSNDRKAREQNIWEKRIQFGFMHMNVFFERNKFFSYLDKILFTCYNLISWNCHNYLSK